MNRERETAGFLKKYPGVKIGIIALILLLVVGVSSAFTVEKEVEDFRIARTFSLKVS